MTDPQEMAEKLLATCLEKGTKDNCTIIVVML